jgi:hypothetical protein
MKVRERSSGTIRSATTAFCPLSGRFSISPRPKWCEPAAAIRPEGTIARVSM